MNPRRINVILRVVTATAVAVSVAVVWFGFAGPLALNDGGLPIGPQPVRSPRAFGTTQPSASEAVATFGASLDRPLRPALTTTADVAVPPGGTDANPSSSGVPPARLQLVGTVGDSLALIRGPDGTTALVEVGDDVDGADVVAIGPSRVDLRQDGRPVLLRKPPPPPESADVVVR